jgi:hypothetical protein
MVRVGVTATVGGVPDRMLAVVDVPYHVGGVEPMSPAAP